ncbi:MAG: hypothetical protein FWD25_03645 [Clostridia bacterium]|nr:hypothetical protein [Clostridia bacterium]
MFASTLKKALLCALCICILFCTAPVAVSERPLNMGELVGAWQGFVGGATDFLVFHPNGAYEVYSKHRPSRFSEEQPPFAGLSFVRFGQFSIGFDLDPNKTYLIFDGVATNESVFSDENFEDRGLLLGIQAGEGSGGYVRATDILFLITWDELVGTWHSEDGTTVFKFLPDHGKFEGVDALGNRYWTSGDGPAFMGALLACSDSKSWYPGTLYLLRNDTGVLRIAPTISRPLEEEQRVYYLIKQ